MSNEARRPVPDRGIRVPRPSNVTSTAMLTATCGNSAKHANVSMTPDVQIPSLTGPQRRTSWSYWIESIGLASTYLANELVPVVCGTGEHARWDWAFVVVGGNRGTGSAGAGLTGVTLGAGVVVGARRAVGFG